jgi:hypothetical protein
MIRMSRAGREQAIVDAISRLQAEGNFKMFYKGEICKKMGIKSTSKIRIILDRMVDEHRLIGASTSIDGYADELKIYGLAAYAQPELLPHEIVINGEILTMNQKGQFSHV